METFFPDDSPLRYWLSKASVTQIACSVSWPPLIAVTGYAPCVRAWSPTSRDEPEFKPVPQLLEVDGERFVACTVKGDLLVAADASTSGRISVWDTATWTRRQTLTADAPVTSLDASRTYIAAGTAAGYVRVWRRQSAADATFVQFFQPDLQLDSLPVYCVRLGPLRPGGGGGGAGGGGGEKGGDGSDCVMVVHTRGNGRVSAWRLSDAKIIGTLGRGGGTAPSDALLSANAAHACLAKGHLLIVSWLPGRDPLLQYVHPVQRMAGEVPHVRQHLAGVGRPLCCDYDGDVIVMGCEDGMVWVWGLLQGYGHGHPQQQQQQQQSEQQQQRQQQEEEAQISHWRGYHAGAVGAVACLPQRGQLASAGADGCVKLWSSAGQLLAVTRLGWQVTSMAVNELALVVGGAEGQVQLLVLLPTEDAMSAAAAASRPTEADRREAAAPAPPAARAEYDYWFDARSPKAAAAASNGGGGGGACGRAREHAEAFASFVPPRRVVSLADLQLQQPGGGGAAAAAAAGGEAGGEAGSGPAAAAGLAADPGAGAGPGGKASSFNMQAALKGAHRSAADQAAAQVAEEEAKRAQLRAMGEGPGVARSRGCVALEGSSELLLGRRCANPSCLQREGVAELRQTGGGGGGGGFKRCGACKSVLYCSAHCQSTHWRDGHKKECARLAEAWRQQQAQQLREQQEQLQGGEDLPQQCSAPDGAAAAHAVLGVGDDAAGRHEAGTALPNGAAAAASAVAFVSSSSSAAAAAPTKAGADGGEGRGTSPGECLAAGSCAAVGGCVAGDRLNELD